MPSAARGLISDRVRREMQQQGMRAVPSCHSVLGDQYLLRHSSCIWRAIFPDSFPGPCAVCWTVPCLMQCMRITSPTSAHVQYLTLQQVPVLLPDA